MDPRFDTLKGVLEGFLRAMLSVMSTTSRERTLESRKYYTHYDISRLPHDPRLLIASMLLVMLGLLFRTFVQTRTVLGKDAYTYVAICCPKCLSSASGKPVRCQARRHNGDFFRLAGTLNTFRRTTLLVSKMGNNSAESKDIALHTLIFLQLLPPGVHTIYNKEIIAMTVMMTKQQRHIEDGGIIGAHEDGHHQLML
uniref:Uncharacterized protein n=1 Tax=Glossina austeni TaxID=7395 RepID=A0A1A9V708_GLOAU